MSEATRIVEEAIADLESRPLTGSGPIEVVRVHRVPEDYPAPREVSGGHGIRDHQEGSRTRVLLRRGDRVYSYVTGADGIPVLQPTGEKDGGQRMVRPPRMDV